MITRQKGFTLMELLVVIAIIGILSAITMTALSLSKDKSSDAKLRAEFTAVHNAAEIYATVNKYNYLATSDTLCATGLFTDTASNMNKVTAVVITLTNGNVDCGATTKAWSMAAVLPSGKGSICVDSIGSRKTYTVTVLTGSTANPHTGAGGTVCN
jgi:prepilin-type N-terminal cleavage/methylation domain-containing protein